MAAKQTGDKPAPGASGPKKRKGRPDRPVVCWETGELFPSARDASRAIGVEATDRITTAIARRATVSGFHWYWEGDPKPDASEFKPRKSRPIRCVETGIVYPTVTAAAKAVGTKSNGTISRAARKDYTAFGYHWKYAD